MRHTNTDNKFQCIQYTGEFIVIFFVNNYLFLTMQSNVTIKNASWPHFSWATLYIFIHGVYKSSLTNFQEISRTHLTKFQQIFSH